MARSVRQPGPDHPITIVANPERVVVRAASTIIADTRKAIALHEASYPAVQYIPRADVDMARLVPSEHTTYCPYKGRASYFSLPLIGARGENAVWTYVDPHAAVAEIADHLAFYADRFRIAED